MCKRLINTYDKYLLGHPRLALLLIFSLLAIFAYHAQDFKLDASADSLVLEDDEDLRTYRKIKAQYGTDDYLILTYTPAETLFTTEGLDRLQLLRDELSALDGVDTVTSILDVPLLQGENVTLLNFGANVGYLGEESNRIESAKRELLSSPLYSDLLLSQDAKTTALLITLKVDPEFTALLRERDRLRALQYESGFTTKDAEKLQAVSDTFHQYNALFIETQKRYVREVRETIEPFKKEAKIFLGGVPMIASDMIDYVASDIVVFGAGVLAIMILTLAVIFRQVRWVVLPIICCFCAVLVLVGLLGYMDWRATVISSNFISLLLIFTLSLNIHLIVRYRELERAESGLSSRDLIRETVRRMFKPCLYTALTTAVGFFSLLVSNIRPVIDFGQMMVIGISVSFIISFLLFPAEVALLKQVSASSRDSRAPSTLFFAKLVEHHRLLIVFVVAVMLGGSLFGVSKLTVENRFIDYFKSDTEIFQGMSFIDRELGGTTPVDLVIRGDEPDYWYDPFTIRDLKEIHNYLESLPQVGKVISFVTFMKMAETLNEGRALDSFFLDLFKEKLKGSIMEPIVKPYISDNYQEVHISFRVRETDANLQRQALIDQIKTDLEGKFHLQPEEYQLSGMLVLYNNMLQSLFKSQILTLGTVLVMIMFMFWFLFHSFTVSIIAILPNLLSVLLVLGLMGLIGIPLDMMTITIAAISVGIAVDDTIHYIHRFKEEFKHKRNYMACVYQCHSTIGSAMLYTSITVVVGFSVLMLSNFIPTIYFGILTGVAMMAAILAALTLLPLLIVMIRPFGREAV